MGFTIPFDLGAFSCVTQAFEAEAIRKAVSFV